MKSFKTYLNWPVCILSVVKRLFRASLILSRSFLSNFSATISAALPRGDRIIGATPGKSKTIFNTRATDSFTRNEYCEIIWGKSDGQVKDEKAEISWDGIRLLCNQILKKKQRLVITGQT